MAAAQWLRDSSVQPKYYHVGLYHATQSKRDRHQHFPLFKPLQMPDTPATLCKIVNKRIERKPCTKQQFSKIPRKTLVFAGDQIG